MMTVEKVAIIVAGGSGMGAAAAEKLASDGYKVAILSSSGKGEALAERLGGLGVTGSNQSVADLQKLVDQTLARWGRIDVLVNSAGHGPRAPILALTDEQWQLGMETYFFKCGTRHASGHANHAETRRRQHYQHLLRVDV